jgi:hypothetical protein
MRKFAIRSFAIALIAISAGLTLFGPEPQAKAAALTDARQQLSLTEPSFPARLGVAEVFAGGLAAVSNDTGLVYPATSSTNLFVIGVFDKSVDNTASAAGYSATRRCVVKQGIFAFSNGATNSPAKVTQTDVGKICYVVDDQTVSTATNNYAVAAGTVVYLEPGGATVWVDVGKLWGSSIQSATLPSLPKSASGLASGRLYLGTATNVIHIVP